MRLCLKFLHTERRGGGGQVRLFTSMLLATHSVVWLFLLVSDGGISCVWHFTFHVYSFHFDQIISMSSPYGMNMKQVDSVF